MKRALLWIVESYRLDPLWFWVPFVGTWIAVIAFAHWALRS